MYYDYICPKCKTMIEIRLSVKHLSDPQKCKKCNSELIKKYTAPNLTFKGQGFSRPIYKGK